MLKTGLLNSKRVILYLALGWTAFIIISLYLSLNRIDKDIYKLALNEAKTNYKKDLLYREWNSMEGGVYVPFSKYSPPNPYITIPERDIETKDNKKYTLINPAYMTRLVHELEMGKNGVKSHMTSLKPIRPENKADKWEEKALNLFENNVTEIHSLENQTNGQKVLRFMAPFVTEKSCLKCHASQGYKVGDIRGGLSISLPYAPYSKMASEQKYVSLMMNIFFGFLGYLALFINYKVTEKYQSKLESSEMNYRILTELSPDAIWVHSEEKIIYANGSALKILGANNLNEIIGKNIFSIIHPDSKELVHQRIGLSKMGSQLEPVIEKIICLNGLIKELEIVSVPIKFRGKDSILVIARDVSELKNALIKAEEMNRIKSIFFANMSHELRTPFVGILGYAQMLDEELKDNDQKEMVKGIIRTSNRLTNTLNRILKLTELEFQGIQVELNEVNINRLINEIHKRYLAAANLKNLQLKKNVKFDFLIIQTDEQKLNEIFDNLINNAIKFTHEGEVGIAAEIKNEDDNNFLEIKISDTGIGIPLEKQKLVWEEFRQVSEGNTRDYQGSGLGLSIVEKYMEHLGGIIDLESEPGKGTTFTIKLLI